MLNKYIENKGRNTTLHDKNRNSIKSVQNIDNLF